MSAIRSHPSLPRLATVVAALALGLGGLTACGGSNSGSNAASTSTSGSAAASSTGSAASGSSTSGGSAEALKATEKDFSISLDEDHLKAGTYTITVVNDGNATHDLAVEEGGTTKAKTDSISPGESATLTVDLDAGTYVFYCAIGNHRAMGMELTVQVS